MQKERIYIRRWHFQQLPVCVLYWFFYVFYDQLFASCYFHRMLESFISPNKPLLKCCSCNLWKFPKHFSAYFVFPLFRRWKIKPVSCAQKNLIWVKESVIFTCEKNMWYSSKLLPQISKHSEFHVWRKCMGFVFFKLNSNHLMFFISCVLQGAT